MRGITKVYLGDSVYVDIDSRGIVLTTENCRDVTNTIVLEPNVYESLTQYLAAVERAAEREKSERRK